MTVACSLDILRDFPFIVAATWSAAASMTMVLRFLDPFGRPSSLPLVPFLNWYSLGGLRTGFGAADFSCFFVIMFFLAFAILVSLGAQSFNFHLFVIKLGVG